MNTAKMERYGVSITPLIGTGTPITLDFINPFHIIPARFNIGIDDQMHIIDMASAFLIFESADLFDANEFIRFEITSAFENEATYNVIGNVHMLTPLDPYVVMITIAR